MPGSTPNTDVRMYRGDDATIRFEVRDNNGKIIPLSGASAIFTVKEAFNSVVPFIQKNTATPAQGIIFDATRGLIDFYLVPADTDDAMEEIAYVYDVKVITSDTKRHTGAVGTFIIMLNVNNQ
jgi:hypothetical protein